MSSEWPYEKLGDITVNLDTKRKPVKEADRKIGPYPYYGASGIVDYVDGYLFDGEHLLIAEDGENLRTRQTPVAFRACGKFWVNNHAHIVIGNERASTRYLEYAVLGTDITSYLTGAVMPKLTQGNLNRIEVPCPPIEMQDAIVGVLGALDDRITLLRETNATLEAIAQALFKSWFIDFDPVRAKMEGRAPEGMDEATAALFPDGLEESELGVVPRGWSLGQLNQFCSIASGKRPGERSDAATPVNDVPLFGGAGVMGYTSESLFDEKRILTGRVGTLGKVHIAHPPFWASDNVLVLLPNHERLFQYCFHWLSSIDVHALNRGSTQPLLTQRDLGRQVHVVPTDSVLDIFSTVTGALNEKLRVNADEAQTLATLRDTLLPRLISGQLRLPEAQALAAEA